MELTDSLKTLFRQTAQTLQGSARRLFMARTVKELGRGGQRRAGRELGWNRETIRKGTHELERGVVCLDNLAARGRKPVEAHLPHLLRLSGRQTVQTHAQRADPEVQAYRSERPVEPAEVIVSGDEIMPSVGGDALDLGRDHSGANPRVCLRYQ